MLKREIQIGIHQNLPKKESEFKNIRWRTLLSHSSFCYHKCVFYTGLKKSKFNFSTLSPLIQRPMYCGQDRDELQMMSCYLQLQHISSGARLQVPESQWRQGGTDQHKVKVGAEWIKEKLEWLQRAGGQWEETRGQAQGGGEEREQEQGAAREETEQAVEKCGHISQCQVWRH